MLRTTAWRAADGVNPSSRSEPISASCHAPSGRGSRYSPSTVSSVERAAGAPTDRRRRTSSTGGTLVDAAMKDGASVRRHDRLSLPVAVARAYWRYVVQPAGFRHDGAQDVPNLRGPYVALRAEYAPGAW